jgi:hypothetical protein
MLKEACHICLFARVAASVRPLRKRVVNFFAITRRGDGSSRAAAKIREALLSHWALNARDSRILDEIRFHFSWEQ